jgi:hypothetical protein
MTFEAWLRKQKDRDDPVGDLANDFIADAKIKYAAKKIKLKLTESYLAGYRDCVIDAFRVARKEYEKESRKLEKQRT